MVDGKENKMMVLCICVYFEENRINLRRLHKSKIFLYLFHVNKMNQ